MLAGFILRFIPKVAFPNRSTIACTAASFASGMLMSHCTPNAEPPVSSIAVATRDGEPLIFFRGVYR